MKNLFYMNKFIGTDVDRLLWEMRECWDPAGSGLAPRKASNL